MAGIVVSFTVFTLFAAWLLDLLGLPDDLLRNLAIALLFLVSISLLVPQVAEWLARPLQRLTRRSGGDLGGGFLLGASLGLVFVPCAGPVPAAVSVIAARRDVGFETVLLTLAYALGARPQRDRALAQLGAIDAPRAPRPGRPDRLLDVLVHQLPPDAAVHPRLRYRAREIFLVLTGIGTVEVRVDGKRERIVRVRGDRLHTLVNRPKLGDHLLELRFTPGVAAYAFTFG